MAKPTRAKRRQGGGGGAFATASRMDAAKLAGTCELGVCELGENVGSWVV